MAPWSVVFSPTCNQKRTGNCVLRIIGFCVSRFQELLHQGEQLDNIETKTDTINEDMKTTQKHLNSIKSVFGGIKNWWSRGSKEEEKEPPSQRQSRLRNTVDAQRDTECEHPAMRLRAEDVRGFYEDDSGYSRGAQQQQQEQRQYSGAMAAHEETFHQNLGQFASLFSIKVDNTAFSGDLTLKTSCRFERTRRLLFPQPKSARLTWMIQ